MTMLTEAGKVFAKRNVERLKACKTAIEAMLGEILDAVGEEPEADAEHPKPKMVTPKGLKAAESLRALADELAIDALDEAADTTIDIVQLQEGAIGLDGTAQIKLISPGWGSSGYYSPAVLERDGPKVFVEGTKMFADHPTPQEEAQRPERSIKDLAAVLTGNAQWQANGPDGPGLYATARVYEAWKQPINDMAPDIGVSIRAMGKATIGEAEGRKGPIIQQIAQARSVDFVTDPGRGGKILSLREAATQRHQPVEQIKEAQNMALTEQEAKALQESVKSLQENQDKLQAENARLTEALLLQQAREFVAGRVPKSLPPMTKARLIEALAKDPILKDGALDTEAYGARIDEAAKAEAEYIAHLTGSGQVKGMGAVAESANPDVETKLTESLAGVFGLSADAAMAAARREV